MNPDDISQRISQITTQWSELAKAHQATTTSAEAARTALLERYSGAVYRYLLGAVRDADVAEELSHEFIVRFLRGDFRRANPDRGRFRNYLKTALINLVNDYFRTQKNQPRALPAEPAAAGMPDIDSDENFTHCWREELLDRTWTALQAARPQYYSVLRLRVEYPDMPASEMAERLTSERAKPMAPATVRKTLERARTKFADLLVAEVAASVETSQADVLEAELKELDLHRYCSAALERQK
jgi:RNA polymerase sigma factor (sigma-70 family)